MYGIISLDADDVVFVGGQLCMMLSWVQIASWEDAYNLIKNVLTKKGLYLGGKIIFLDV